MDLIWKPTLNDYHFINSSKDRRFLWVSAANAHNCGCGDGETTNERIRPA